jgi:sarcosine oxidase subunit gamma
MSVLLTTRGAAARFGLKGPAAANWLAAHSVPVPAAPNSWAGAAPDDDAGILVARLGAGEFFVEEGAAGSALRGLDPEDAGPGVYPVLREDAAYAATWT